MQRFLRDNEAISLAQQEFKGKLGKIEIPDGTVGSVNESLTKNIFALPSNRQEKH